MRVLITGGAGFIGAWIARGLAQDGHAIRVFDLAQDRSVMAAIGGADLASGSEWIAGDITDAGMVERAAAGCDAIIHLAGMLTTACQAQPRRGAEVNLIGTINVFEAALKAGIRRVVYTSSAAVFGPEDGTLPNPITHYGAFKLACEGVARAYLADHGLGSIGFRPYVVYGPGRDSGLTAGPTLACRAAARGEAYHIGYRGRAGMIHVADVAAAYRVALAAEPGQAEVFNLSGEVASVEEIVAAILACVPGARITSGGPDLPFTPDIPDAATYRRFPGLRRTSLREGIAETIAHYRAEGT